MPEIAKLKKQLADAKAEIADLTMRLKNAEFLYLQLSAEEPKAPKPETPK